MGGILGIFIGASESKKLGLPVGLLVSHLFRLVVGKLVVGDVMGRFVCGGCVGLSDVGISKDGGVVGTVVESSEGCTVGCGVKREGLKDGVKFGTPVGLGKRLVGSDVRRLVRGVGGDGVCLDVRAAVGMFVGSAG